MVDGWWVRGCAWGERGGDVISVGAPSGSLPTHLVRDRAHQQLLEVDAVEGLGDGQQLDADLMPLDWSWFKSVEDRRR
jgi:hypothetical protein